MPFLKLSKLQRHRISLFFICFAMAVAGWLFFALSNKYNYHVETVLHYTKLPQNKAFHPLQQDTVTLQIEGSGWQLLFSKLRIKPKSIDVNLKELGKRNFITFTDQLKELNLQFTSSQKVVSVQPDTLYFDFLERSIRKIPVKLIYHIGFKGQYDICDKIQMLPEYLMLTGPIEDLDSIKYWETDTLKLMGVDHTINTKVLLKSASKPNINIYPTVISVKIPVDEFTEKEVEVPVTIQNNRNFEEVKLLPEKVKITFMVSLRKYAKIDARSFKATVDLQNGKLKNYNQLPVILAKFPEFCKIIKVEPQNVDFIISK